MTESIAEHYRRTAEALPAGWRLDGLRCASTGLAVALRSERWIAEACGPLGECLRLEAATPEDALHRLAAAVDVSRNE